MIVDNLKNCGLYCGVNKKFQKAFDFLKKATEEKLPNGRYEIDGDKLFAVIQEYMSRPEEECSFEGHRKYIDIQYITKECEVIDVVDIFGAKEICAYNSEKDVAFFENTAAPSACVIKAGEYGIFFPHDIHRPGQGLDVKNPVNIKKIVVKVLIEE